ncbi:MAG TPA: hypothetical protein VFC24_13380 [Casimicrobiaceae bacterium]|nr:hypothetical protein [Casimicrobiaceae bacterium]
MSATLTGAVTAGGPRGASEVHLHRLYRHYAELPLSQRVLYTAALVVLGLAYLFATTYLYHTYAGRAGGNPMILSYKDIVAAYSGTGKGSRLEAALRGPMSRMLPPYEAQLVIDWVHDGTKQDAYEAQVKPMLERRCMSCHDGSNPHLPNLAGFDNVKKVTEADTGTDVFTLIRISHIHLFGLTMMFFILGLMYTHAYVRPVWFKCTVVAMPFLFLVVDILSWYITKVFHPFALVVMAAGGLMAVCFAFMWVTTMWQMWISPPPAPVLQRGAVDTSPSVD